LLYGNVLSRRTLVLGVEGIGGGTGRSPVYGRLFAFYHITGSDNDGKSISEYRLAEIHINGNHGHPVEIQLQETMGAFFTSTVRAGCAPSNVLDLFGSVERTMKYVRIKLQ